MMIEVDTQVQDQPKETKAQLPTTVGVLDIRGFN
jgi:hypothetical protein